MQYRHLGRSGLQVSTIGSGTNQFGGKVDQAGVNQIIETAIDLGINLIDTADVYQEGRSESTLGLALKGKWNKVVLATKGFNATGDGPNDQGASRFHLITAVEDSLRRLQSDHIDLYQMHRWDAGTPIEETLRGAGRFGAQRQGALYRRVQLFGLAAGARQFARRIEPLDAICQHSKPLSHV